MILLAVIGAIAVTFIVGFAGVLLVTKAKDHRLGCVFWIHRWSGYYESAYSRGLYWGCNDVGLIAGTRLTEMTNQCVKCGHERTIRVEGRSIYDPDTLTRRAMFDIATCVVTSNYESDEDRYRLAQHKNKEAEVKKIKEEAE